MGSLREENCTKCGWYDRMWNRCTNPDSKHGGEWVGECDTCDKFKKKEKKKVELKETAKMMGSEDYKERFKAEYYQTKIRYEKLHKMCIKYEAGTLEFLPDSCLNLLQEQLRHMGEYLKCLEIRAEIEEIKL